MFDGATAFNQNIGEWNVSNARALVSNEHSFGLQHHTRCNALTHDFLFSPFVRVSCFWRLKLSTKISALGI
jgi:hypothetical protein